jgi:hypothetical protein
MIYWPVSKVGGLSRSETDVNCTSFSSDGEAISSPSLSLKLEIRRMILQ